MIALAVLRAAEFAAPAPVSVCGPLGEQGVLCRVVYGATDSSGAARASEILAKPFRIALILAVAWIVTRILRVLVRRFVKHISTNAADRFTALGKRTGISLLTPAEASLRREQRANTIGTVLRSLVSLLVWSTAAIMCMQLLGISLAALGISVGILGAALAFGSQALVRDLVTGAFMLVEDQYGVGDVVDLGSATGTVEHVTLRLTRVRDVDGVVWYVPNGEIRRVGNKTQQWAVVNLDVPVAYETDIDLVIGALNTAGAALSSDAEIADALLLPPEGLGIESISADRILVRISIRTVATKQWVVARALRGHVKKALDDAGIDPGLGQLGTPIPPGAGVPRSPQPPARGGVSGLGS